VLKNRASGRDPALCGFCKCSHILEYAVLSKTPHALADGLMLVFEHPVTGGGSAGFRLAAIFYTTGIAALQLQKQRVQISI
jgi:hypothetical protein